MRPKINKRLPSYNKYEIIFSFFIECGVYEMIAMDISVVKHGLPYFIC